MVSHAAPLVFNSRLQNFYISEWQRLTRHLDRKSHLLNKNINTCFSKHFVLPRRESDLMSPDKAPALDGSQLKFYRKSLGFVKKIFLLTWVNSSSCQDVIHFFILRIFFPLSLTSGEAEASETICKLGFIFKTPEALLQKKNHELELNIRSDEPANCWQ